MKTTSKFSYSFLYSNHPHHLCVSDGNLNLYTWFNADGGDLLDNLRWAVQINQALVDPHLEAIPGFGSFTTGSLSGGDAQSLKTGRKSRLSLTVISENTVKACS